jgi:hypothetical protein
MPTETVGLARPPNDRRTGLQHDRIDLARKVTIGAGLPRGGPALAVVLDAAAGTTDRYQGGLAELDAAVTRLAHRRATQALARIEAGRLASFGEYDRLLRPRRTRRCTPRPRTQPAPGIWPATDSYPEVPIRIT